MQAKIEIIKGLLENVAAGQSVTLLVPRGYILYAEEFKDIDERIKRVEVNRVHGWTIETIQTKDSKTFDVNMAPENEE